jgi:hypothetical protein
MSTLRDALVEALDCDWDGLWIETPMEDGSALMELDRERHADRVLATPAGQRIAAVVEMAERLTESVLDRPFADPDDDAAKAARIGRRALNALGGKR